jgi:signal transduction histidine kinase
MAVTFKQGISLKYKLLLIFIPVIMFVGIFVFYASSINDNINSSFSRVNKSFENFANVINLKTSVDNLSSIAKVYSDSRDATWIEQYDSALKIFNDLLSKIYLSADWEEGSNIIKEFKKTTADLQKTEASAIKRAKAGDKGGALGLFDNSYNDKIALSGNLLYTFVDKESLNVSKEITDNQDFLIMRETFFISFAILFFLIILLVVVRVFNSQVIQPVERLAKVTKVIANGNLATRAEIIHGDELGSLAYNFNIMLDRLQHSHSLLNMTITDLNRANEKLKTIDQMKSDFVTIAAHQLRTPLTGIKWALMSIVNGDMGPIQDMQKQYLTGAAESNQRMIDTVNEILKMSDIQDGSFVENRISVDLVSLLNSVLFDIYPQATQKSIKIKLDIDKDSLLEVDIDPGQMRVALQNILENSILYSKEKGKVDIKMGREGQNIMISIRDYGIGIPEGEQVNVFTKFFRATNAIKHFANGSGLGLLIAKKIIERSGGKIWFESEEDKGAVFHISLPV